MTLFSLVLIVCALGVLSDIWTKYPYTPTKLDYVFFVLDFGLAVVCLFDPGLQVLAIAFAVSAFSRFWYRNLFRKPTA